MTEREQKIRDIESAEMLIKSGNKSKLFNTPEVKAMMKKIAANAVCIGLYNFNHFIISNIADGDFTAIKSKWESVINDFNRRMEIIDNEGEDLNNILTPEEIAEAVNYTIFEQTSESDGK